MPLTLEQINTFYASNDLEAMLSDLVTKGYLKYEHPKRKLGTLEYMTLCYQKGII